MNGDKNQAGLANSGSHFVITSTQAGTFGRAAIFLVCRDGRADRRVDRGCYGWAYCVPEFRRDEVQELPAAQVGRCSIEDEAPITAIVVLPAPQWRGRSENAILGEAERTS